ncbi:MAG: prepilin-type N-terminal cleavage/methylation domain-containing protein [Ignavibacteriales bacterium]
MHKTTLKNKGFTLIELLAVIVILAIIALISVPIIQNIIDNVQKSSLEIIKNNMKKAAEFYVFANPDRFNLGDGEKEYIQLSQLEGRYLKKVENPGGTEACEGYVKVEKENDNNNLIYTPYLDCANGNNLLVDSSYVNYGGNYLDNFTSIKKTADGGYIVVGGSNSTAYSGNTAKGNTISDDGIIVKYNSNGIEEWSRNFGGSSIDYFYDVVEDTSGYVVVGQTTSSDGDLAGLDIGDFNSILVKYNKQGDLVNKKVIVKRVGTSGSSANSIILSNGNYYVTGNSRNVNGVGANLMYIISYDSDFNQLSANTYGGTSSSVSNSIITNSKNNLMIVGNSSSVNNEMVGIKIGIQGNSDAVIFEIDSTTKSIVSKGIFGGTDGNESFNDIIEVSDGYIAIGNSDSTDHDMAGLNNGGIDAIVVKYSKTPDVNGVLPIIWKKVIGGTNSDLFRSIINEGNELIIVGESNSIDFDLEEITKASNQYYDGFLVRLDLSGNILGKETYGGTKSDYLTNIIKDGDKLVAVGRSFSTDNDIEPFNLGNSDALMINFDLDLNPIKNFKLKTLLKSVPQELVKNYGTSIPLPANKDTLNLYTTNDATKDLESWCGSGNIDPNSNYNYVICLKPFDTANIKLLYSNVFNYANSVNVSVQDSNNWLKLYFYFGNAGAGNEVSNVKVTFEGETAVTIQEAVNLGYIEPLVLLGDARSGTGYFFENSFNIISGGTSGLGTYASISVLMKPKNKKLLNISFASAKEHAIVNAKFNVYEFNNYDISLTPAE